MRTRKNGQVATARKQAHAARCNENTMRKHLAAIAKERDTLRKLAQASLDARDKEARAAMSLENAKANFHRHDAEERAYEKAMIEASIADKALRDALMTPNAGVTGA